MKPYLDASAYAWNEFQIWRKSAGWDAAVTRLSQRFVHRFPSVLPATKEVRARGARFPVHVRFGGSSDYDVFEQIFVEREYASLLDISNPRYLLDLGANVGYSSVFFLSAFPQARTLSVEPDPRNFAMLRKNLAPYGERAQCVHGAVWSENGTVELSQGTFGDNREWATEVKPLTGGPEGNAKAVQSYDIPTLMAKANFPHVDLLKVDIEGSEVALFGPSSRAWLPKVANLCVELHGPDCEAALNRALEGFTYKRSWAGELTICRDIRPAG